MTRLDWNNVGERFYETGVDRGVLYLDDGGVAWPGLVSVSEAPSGGEARPFYIDGIKYLNLSSAEEFEATIEAFSSPFEFALYSGLVPIHNGLFAAEQPKKQFGFSYRTRIGNGVDGTDHGYKIHLVYNALAGASEQTHQSITDSAELEPRSWSITTLPPILTGRRPTAHFVIDSRYTPTYLLSTIEDILYGTDAWGSRLLTVQELIDLFEGVLSIEIALLDVDIYQIVETEMAGSRAIMSTLPPRTPGVGEDPVLWLDTSTSGYAVPRLVTGG